MCMYVRLCCISYKIFLKEKMRRNGDDDDGEDGNGDEEELKDVFFLFFSSYLSQFLTHDHQ